MDPNHLFSLPLQSNPCRLDPCLHQSFLALPLTKSTLGVWNTREAKQFARDKSKHKPIELDGHTKQINSVAFANGLPCLLASSCCEKILVWDFQHYNPNSNSEIKSRLFFDNPGELYVMAFSNNNKIIAGGKGSSITLHESGHTKVDSTLDMHDATVTGLKFCPHYSSTLVSISDDRTCCVWDVTEKMILYQSSILASAPLLSLAMSLISPCVTVGSGDGKVITFDLSGDHGFRQLMNIDIASAIRKENEKVTKQSTTNNKTSVSNDCEKYAESSESILSIEYIYFSQSSERLETLLGQNVSGAGEIIKDTPPILNIITTNHIVLINSRTFEFQNLVKLQSSIKSETFASSLTVGAVSYASAKQIGQFEISVVAGTIFDRKIHVLDWYFMNEKLRLFNTESIVNDVNVLDIKTDVKSDCELSVVAVNDLELNSPLKSEMLPPIIKSTATKGDIATGKKKPASKLNQPLTFKSNVKSSGYSQAPRTTMFKPETSRQKLLNLSNPMKKQPSMKPMAGKILKSDSNAINWCVQDCIDTLEVDNQTTAVLNLRFADDGTSLACALSNKSAMIVKSPFSRHICTSLIGHNHSVNSVYWSYCNSFLLTSSNDKTVRLWDKSSGEPLLIMTHKKHTPKDGPKNQSVTPKTSSHIHKHSQSSTSITFDNKPFSKEITRAQFYYMDKFILVTHGPELSLYKYHVSPEVDELKRYQSLNKYKLVDSWTTSSTSFTSSSAINNFFSHLVLCTTSGKSIEIYDVNKSLLSHSFTECHSRPPHHISLNEGSCFSSQSSQAYNVIATIAPTDPIKLWDLRSKSCVQALVGHHNKAHSCQIAFSPCGNYLTSGSEDRSLYIFDLRKGTFCEKLKGPSDVVFSVAYHPAKSLLAAGCLDSKILWYK